mmetsp:Transcript_9284/g.25137  ORF Transcript_9284/g.25137 Transcript_9284/m.25137 type:complete len:228 (+) Transcript_9284:200-883(+)
MSCSNFPLMTCITRSSRSTRASVRARCSEMDGSILLSDVVLMLDADMEVAVVMETGVMCAAETCVMEDSVWLPSDRIDKPAPYPMQADRTETDTIDAIVAVVAGNHQGVLLRLVPKPSFTPSAELCALPQKLEPWASAVRLAVSCGEASPFMLDWMLTLSGWPSSYTRPPTASMYPPGIIWQTAPEPTDEESTRGSPCNRPITCVVIHTDLPSSVCPEMRPSAATVQ